MLTRLLKSSSAACSLHLREVHDNVCSVLGRLMTESAQRHAIVAVTSMRLEQSQSSAHNGLDPKGTDDGTWPLHLRRRRPRDRSGTAAAQPPRGDGGGRSTR